MNGSYALIGNSAIIRHVQHLVLKIAEGSTTVLITGEPGTGKELIASMIHERSARQGNPFLPVRCVPVSEDQLEAELLGVEVSAHQKPRTSSLLQANTGTVFLDEVSRLSPRLQHLLLQLLQENMVQPIGAQSKVPFQARIICGSSVDLEQLVRRGSFREDLFYKLSASSIYLPPLRERREDIALLADYFLQKYNKLKSKKITNISHDAMNALLQNTWQNNIQELENLIERVTVLKNAGSIEICDLPPKLRALVTDNIDTFYDKKPEPAQFPTNNHGGALHNNHGARPYQAPYASHGAAHTNHQPAHGGHNPYGQSTHNNHYATLNHTPATATSHTGFGRNAGSNHLFPQNYLQTNNHNPQTSRLSLLEDLPSEIDQFIKKEIDLGSGIDFYRVVEEFENRLISEALRRTNHNKNRAAQLLSMNRTTLVEKLKKRAANSSMKSEGNKIKRNAAFTIFDGLGAETNDFDGIDYLSVSGDEG